jgi:integrase
MYSSINVIQKKKEVNPIDNFLSGYWENDIWNVDDDEMRQFYVKPLNIKTKTMDFSYLPFPIKKELKYYFAYRLTEDTLTIQTVLYYYLLTKHLNDLFNRYYQSVNTISEIPYEDIIFRWRNLLNQKGVTTIKKDGSDHGNISFLSQLHKFISYLYDEREEYDKDVWDCRKIPCIRITENKANYMLNFTEIPLCFRNMVKRYIKFRSTSNSISNCQVDILSLRLFIKNILNQEPEWSDLTKLKRVHIETYLAWLLCQTKGLTSRPTEYLNKLRYFLEYIQRAQYPEAPDLPSACLIFKEDIPKNLKRHQEEIKYIPEGVIYQFEDNIENIKPARFQPVAIILRASGWRISDVLNLKYDSCLEQTTKGWYLHGDIPKVSVLNHRVPITDEVAAAIKVFAREIEEKSNEINNPNHLLFVSFRGRRKGYCYRGCLIRDAFNRLSNEFNITDDAGNIYHFGNHAFRHTKAVELINNGMNLLHVQKWMAHASPEMTLRYAKILDDTMRSSWEEVIKKGLFKIDREGKAIPINPNDITDEDIIEWEYIKNNLDAVRMPLGYCLKSKKQECHTQLNPCLTCRNLCTTVEFIPQFEHEIREIKQLIETGKKLGRDIWVEKNEYLLNRYMDILTVLKTGKTHHKAGKKGREYVGGERNG